MSTSTVIFAAIVALIVFAIVCAPEDAPPRPLDESDSLTFGGPM